MNDSAESVLHRNQRLWERHVIAENRRHIDRLLATLADDCIYTVMPTGETYKGKTEVARFYQTLWEALPDVELNLTNRVIGLDCVVEESVVRGTHRGYLFGIPPSDATIEFPLVIIFPIRDELFTGERLYFDLATIQRQISAVYSEAVRWERTQGDT